MRHSMLFDFTDSDDYSLSSAQISQEVLSLTSGSSTGTMTTEKITMDDDFTQCELRIKAGQHWDCTYAASNNSGLSYETVTPGTVHTFTTTGNKLKFKINLIEPSSGVSPEFDKVCLLLK